MSNISENVWALISVICIGCALVFLGSMWGVDAWQSNQCTKEKIFYIDDVAYRCVKQ